MNSADKTIFFLYLAFPVENKHVLSLCLYVEIYKYALTEIKKLSEDP